MVPSVKSGFHISLDESCEIWVSDNHGPNRCAWKSVTEDTNQWYRWGIPRSHNMQTENTIPSIQYHWINQLRKSLELKNGPLSAYTRPK